MIKAIPTEDTLSNDTDLTWRDRKYKNFYRIVDQLVHEIQEHVWTKTGKPKRRLKGDSLEKLHYSVECLVRDCVTVDLQRHRKGEANLISLDPCLDILGLLPDLRARPFFSAFSRNMRLDSLTSMMQHL